MKKLAPILFVLLLTYPFYAQTESLKDLKVGLVLSGGGAKGFAHIGVLKALEEQGIQIDYIGGTSMGSIVGAMYASGYSAVEIEQIVMQLGFDKYMDAEITRPDKPFFQKENDDKYAVKLPVVNNNITLPSGWTNGQNVMNQLSKYLQHVSTVTDFNALPIPFLCIATDLEKGEQVVLNKGNLAQSIRASVAFPTVVKPIEIDGKWLVDGGLVNNFPVKEVRKMGAEFIIGVDVSSNTLYKKEDLQSVLKIMEQMVSYQMVNDDILAKKDLTDIYIIPLDETRFTTFSFEKAQEIIQFGYDTAMLQIEALKALKTLQSDHQKAVRPQVEIRDDFTIKEIRFSGSKHYQYGYLIEKLQLKKGKHITFEDLFNGINRLWATGNFTQIEHKVVLNQDEGSIFITLTESDIKSFLQIGAHYDDLFKAGVLLNWTDRQILFGNDFLSADVVIGENFRNNIQYLRDNGAHLSVGLQSVLQKFDFETKFAEAFSTFDPTMNYTRMQYLNLSNRLNFQYVYRDNFAWGFGGEHQYLKVENTNPQAIIETYENAHFTNLYSYFKFDTYNNRMFPKSGFYMDLSVKWHMTSSSNNVEFQSFLQGKASLGYAIPLAKKWFLQLQTEGGLSFSKNENPFLDFHLGGTNDNALCNYITFYGYPFAAMGHSSYLKSAATLRFEWTKNHYLGFTGNIGRTDENFLEHIGFAEHTKTGFALFYGINSIAGPLQITYASSPELKNNIFSVRLGYWF